MLDFVCTFPIDRQIDRTQRKLSEAQHGDQSAADAASHRAVRICAQGLWAEYHCAERVLIRDERALVKRRGGNHPAIKPASEFYIALIYDQSEIQQPLLQSAFSKPETKTYLIH